MKRAVTITLGFSECPEIHEGETFYGDGCWQAAATRLNTVGKPDLGYWKTDFTVTFADGFEWTGRYDIGADRYGLDDHIAAFIHAVVDEGAWSPSPETIAELTEFRDNYEIGDALATH